jgi:hypothetical protein
MPSKRAATLIQIKWARHKQKRRDDACDAADRWRLCGLRAPWINPETAEPEYRIVDGPTLTLINPGMAVTKKAPPERG